MPIMRILKEEGKEKFLDYISSTFKGERYPKPNLNTERYSTEFEPFVNIDDNFIPKTKLDMAKYLSYIFEKSSLKREDVIAIGGLWSLIAYIWFEQLTDGKRKIYKMPEKYICVPYTDFKLFKVHLLAPYVNYYMMHKDFDPPFYEMFLYMI
ncbi:MAG: hypothetical protein QXX30_04275 [Candidatus Aenigmatarchaeota archaeon]